MNGSSRGIFMEIMSYRVPVLLALNIGITLYAIPLLTYVLGQGFRLVRKLISSLVEGVTNPYTYGYVTLLIGERAYVCVDLTRPFPLTQTGMADFVAGRAMTDAAHRKRVKYETKCSDIAYDFLPFLFSSLGELEKDVVALLK
ncbi:hypothetical protein Tco_0821348 [Tanacetum coccineum]|uniref:Uncharacterized protein n=1 Tax=Tanacetum coccineum TaxID=301880 RepID=A0ABQ5AGC2_9ASTR